MPTCTDADLGGDVSSRMKWPIVNDFRIVTLLDPLVAVDHQLHLGEVDVDGVVMPLVVADLEINLFEI